MKLLFLLFWMVVVIPLINIDAHPPVNRGTAELIKAGILTTTPQPNLNDGTWYYNTRHGIVFQKDHPFFPSTTQTNSLTTTQLPTTQSSYDFTIVSNHTFNGNISTENETRTYNLFDVVFIVIITIAICITMFCILCYIYYKHKGIHNHNNMAPISSPIPMYSIASAYRHCPYREEANRQRKLNPRQMERRNNDSMRQISPAPASSHVSPVDNASRERQSHQSEKKMKNKSSKLRNDKSSKLSSSSSSDLSTNKRCYFSVPRISKLEKKPRPRQSEVSLICSNDLISCSILLDNKNECHGAKNEAELVFARGAAEFDFNLEDTEKTSEISQRFLCTNHRNEFSKKWNQTTYRHVSRLRDSKQQSRIVCSMPNIYSHHPNKYFLTDKKTHYVKLNEAQEFLSVEGVLLHVGLPICEIHARFLKERIGEYYDIPQPLPEDNVSEHQHDFNFDDDIIPPRPRPIYSDISGDDYDKSENENKAPEPDLTADEKETIKQFLKAMGLSRTKAKKLFSSLQPEVKRKKVSNYRSLQFKVAEFIAPGQAELLLSLANKTSNLTSAQQKSCKIVASLLADTKDQYEAATNFKDRKEVIAQVANSFTYSTLLDIVPHMSKYFFSACRLIAARRKVEGKAVDVKRISYKLNHSYVLLFLEFITSSHITTPLPFGKQIGRLPGGKKVELLPALRNFRNSEIIAMYEAYLKEIGREDAALSPSVMRNILKVCAAKRRMSLHCVDYFRAQGEEAFESMDTIIDDLFKESLIEHENAKDLKNGFKNGLTFLNGDFRMHIKEYSKVADNCWTFALSDPIKKEFQSKCNSVGDEKNHEHSLRSERMGYLMLAISNLEKEIISSLNAAQEDNNGPLIEKLEEFRDEMEDNKENVNKMIAHYVRCAFSENQRKVIISSLKNGEAFLVIDYAQKFLPQKYNESQRDYFGKKGLSWHICHVKAKINNQIVEHTIVHFLGFEVQNAQVVGAVIHDILTRLKGWGIENVILRSDSAAYYRNAELLTSIPQISDSVGIKVSRYNFSESQFGKGPADSDGARIKRRIYDYIDSGKNVTNLKEMFDATGFGIIPLQSLTTIMAMVESKETKATVAIPNISLISDIAYNKKESSLTIWKHYGVGKGKTIKLPKPTPNSTFAKLNIIEVRQRSTTDPTYCFWRRSNKLSREGLSSSSDSVATDNEDETDGETFVSPEDEARPTSEKNIFYCPEPNCVKVYRKAGNLRSHLVKGNHKKVPEFCTQYEYLAKMYNDQLELDSNELQTMSDAWESTLNISENNPLEEGWALKKTATRMIYTKEMYLFLDTEIQKSLITKKRIDPNLCAKKMASLRKDGLKVFPRGQKLSAQQIGAYISRKVTKIRENLGAAVANNSEESDVITEELNDETGDINIEFQDEPMFLDEFDTINENIGDISQLEKDSDSESDEPMDL